MPARSQGTRLDRARSSFYLNGEEESYGGDQSGKLEAPYRYQVACPRVYVLASGAYNMRKVWGIIISLGTLISMSFKYHIQRKKSVHVFQGLAALPRVVVPPRAIPLIGRRVVVVDAPRVAPVRLVLTLGVLPKPVLRTVPRLVPRAPLVLSARRCASSSAFRAAASRCCSSACSRRSAACLL